MRGLVILVIAITLSACSGLLLSGGSAGGTAEGSPAEKDAPNDASLVSAINSKFAEDLSLAPLGISVRSSAGKVTLSGSVPTYALRESAEKQALATRGVKAVDNRITVKR
jgi:hyperosmotically inducible protein